MQQESLEDILAKMQHIDDSKEYYAFTLTSEGEGHISCTTQTQFAGFVDEKHVQELRVPIPVDPHWMLEAWNTFQQPYVIVNDDHQYFIFSFIGGNALVAKDVVQRWEPELLEPDACVRSGYMGFVSIRSLPKHILNRDPNPKQRMRILKRDDYRCRICGRRPADYVDIELHVHHIRPWAKGGVTEDENLITLCQTCHKGLEPHEEYSLFKLIRPEQSVDALSDDFLRRVYRYRQVIRDAYLGLKQTK